VRYLVQRLIQFVIVFVIVTFVVLAATRIGSTDPLRDLAGGLVNDERLAEVAADYPYLDEPLPVQYLHWLRDMFTGDWGYSYAQNQSVLSIFQQRIPPTFFIGFWSIVIGLVVAVPLGVYSAYRRDALFDKTSSVGSFAVISMPPLVVAVALLYLVVSRFEFFPTSAASTYIAPWTSPVEHFKNFFIPALTIGIGLGAIWSRFLRADMILTLQSDFITLARAKGLSPRRILWVHALRSSVLSLITSVALQMSALISGAVIAESFFGPRGIGDRLVFAIQGNDLLVIQAVTAVIVIVVLVVNLVVDFIYAAVDPRIRLARTLG
jgi:peptide/nickel transport system permease protein